MDSHEIQAQSRQPETGSSQQPRKKKCGVLGVTGSVGQRFAQLLDNHPWLEPVVLGASDATAAKKMKYKDVVNWKQSQPVPDKIGELNVVSCDPANFKGCDLVFSGLDSGPAEELEVKFKAAGINVFSNAKTHRQDRDVPLVVATANMEHLDLVKAQQEQGPGFIVCNSNCAVVGIVVPLAALQAAFGPVDIMSVTTVQALSGAGYPGVSAVDINDNAIFYIRGEEDKIQPEARKILGAIADDKASIQGHQLNISVTCSRGNVTDGHTVVAALRFANRPPPTAEACKQVMRDYKCTAQQLGLPSAPKEAIHVSERVEGPQPRLDRSRGDGYTVTIGRVREDPSGVFDIMFVSLSHNTVLGAAGGSILNAEACIQKGYL